MTELSDFQWSARCKVEGCKSRISGRGLKTVPCVEEFITRHAKETGHTEFEMDAFGHTIIIEDVTEKDKQYIQKIKDEIPPGQASML